MVTGVVLYLKVSGTEDLTHEVLDELGFSHSIFSVCFSSAVINTMAKSKLGSKGFVAAFHRGRPRQEPGAQSSKKQSYLACCLVSSLFSF